MVEQQSKEVVDNMSDDLKVQPAMALPRNIVNSIQPVYPVNAHPPVTALVRVDKSTTGSSIIFTGDVKKDVSITAAQLSGFSTAAADDTSWSLQYDDSITGNKTLLRIHKNTLTAFADHAEITFNPPLRLKNGGNIRLLSTFTVGANTVSGGVFGFQRDKQ